MSTTRTEVLGITMLVQDLYKSEFLEPYLDKNDKTPSWDGNIFVYENESHKKDCLMGKIPVQVKSSMVGDLSEDTIQYRIATSDLINYKNDGGVLYFVIHIDNKNNHKTYFTTLLPFDIQRYIEGMKKPTQKSVDVSLISISSESAEQVYLICKNFIINKRMQSPLYRNEKTLEDFNKVTFTIASNPGRIEEYILNNPIYIYGKNDEISLPIPIEKVNIEIISRGYTQKVRVGAQTYYSEYEFFRSKEKDLIKIGKGTVIDLFAKKVDFTAKGTLNERLNEYEFIRDVINGGILYLGEFPMPIVQTEESVKDGVNDYLKYLSDVKSLLQYFNINKDLMMDELTTIEYGNLNALIGSILYNRKGAITIIKKGVTHLALSNLVMTVLVDKDNEGNTTLENYFSDVSKKPVCKIKSRESSEEYEISPYAVLKAEDITISSNLDLNVIEESIKAIEPTTEQQLLYINVFLLELIKAYDTDNNLKGCLDTAMNLYTWLEEHGGNILFIKLNKLQIYKRTRVLTEEEIEYLMECRKKEEDNYNLCGISILLNNKIDFDYYFKKLTKEQQEEFKNYPICSLIDRNLPM